MIGFVRSGAWAALALAPFVLAGCGSGPKVVKVLKFSKSGNHRAQVKKIKVLGNQRLAAGGELKRSRRRIVSVKKTAAE